MGRLAAGLSEHEEEAQAQNKVVIGLLLLILIYPAAFGVLWAVLSFTSHGALVAGLTVWAFAYYHTRLVNDNYLHFKRVIAAWRVLLGVWAPKRWDLSLAALSQYTTPLIPQESRWVDRSKRSCTPVELPVVPLQQAQKTTKTTEPPAPVVVPTKKRKRPDSRRIMRHVLRARGEAVRALASFFAALEAAGEGKCVVACVHLARRFGWVVDLSGDEVKVKTTTTTPTTVMEGQSSGGQGGQDDVQGYRRAREVIAFLRSRGAKIATLERVIEGDWAGALVSEEDSCTLGGSEAGEAEADSNECQGEREGDRQIEGAGAEGESEGDEDDMVWVPSDSEARPDSTLLVDWQYRT